MTKKNYLVMGIVILIFLIIILYIFIIRKDTSLKKEILSSQDYEIAMKNCNEVQTTFPKETVKKVLNKLDNISDNGPFTGNSDTCYNTITITYDKNGIINYIEIKIIDTSSITIKLNGTTRYYTNAKEVIDYLNNLFTIY